MSKYTHIYFIFFADLYENVESILNARDYLKMES